MNRLASIYRRVVIASSKSLLTLLILIFAFVVFVFTTTLGLKVLTRVAAMMLPGQVSIQQIEGSLMKGVSVKGLTYTDPSLTMHIMRGQVDWKVTRHPWHLAVLINNLHIKTLRVVHQDNASSKDARNQPLTIPAVPFDIYINQLVIDTLSMDKTTIQHAQLTASMNYSSWLIKQLTAEYQDHLIDFNAQGQLQTPFDLSAALHIKPISENQGVTGYITAKGNQTEYNWDGQFTGDWPLHVSGTLKHLQQLNSKLSMGANYLTISGKLPDQLHLTIAMPEPHTIHPALASLKTTIEASGDINGTQHGQFSLVISPGLFELPKDSSVPSIPFQGGRVSITLTPEALDATVNMMLNPNEIIKGYVRLPKFTWNHATSLNQPVDGSLNLHVKSLAFLNELISGINDFRGQLLADLVLKGSVGAPTIEGTLKVLDAGFSLPDAGIVLNPIQVTLTSQNKHWDVVGAIAGGEGHAIQFKGAGEWLPQMTGSISIQGEHFLIFNTPEYTIHISPQLLLKLDKDTIDVTGVVDIPAARLKPMTFSETDSLTSDVIFVRNEPAKTPALMSVKASVLVKVGEDVVIDAQGLHGLLGGQIQMTQPLDGSLNALGELTIRDGSYKAYGQDLAIHSGQLIFSGATPDNPKIILRAVRTFNNTSQFSGSNQLFDFNASNLQSIDFGNHLTVGVDVGGYLNSPTVKLFSIPSSLSQADILSLLLLGKPANQASQSGGQLLLTAISAMHLDSGAKGVQLLSQLKQTVGLDFDVKSDAMANQSSNMGNTAFVVGKALSKRLYLSYSVGLLQQNSNVLILKYLLNKFFSVQVTASSMENGVDLLYSA